MVLIVDHAHTERKMHRVASLYSDEEKQGSWQIMTFAFLMLAFVFKFGIMQKMPHLKKLRTLVLMKQMVGFFQLSLVLLVQYLAKTKIIPHLRECGHTGFTFKTKLRTHAILSKGYVFDDPEVAVS